MNGQPLDKDGQFAPSCKEGNTTCSIFTPPLLKIAGSNPLGFVIILVQYSNVKVMALFGVTYLSPRLVS